MVKETEYEFNEEKISYEIKENGYDIYRGGISIVEQHEPCIPYPSLGYEGSCLKQIEEMCSEPEVAPDTTEQRLSALESENEFLSNTLDDILTNIIPSLEQTESEVN